MIEDKLKVFVIGAGGHGKDVAAIISDIDYLEFMGFLDDDELNQSSKGTLNKYLTNLKIYGSKLRYVIGVNDSKTRKTIAHRMEQYGGTPVSVIHPSVKVLWIPDMRGSNPYISDGCVLGPDVVLTPYTKLGKHTHLNTAVSVNQSSTLGDFCTVSPGARICGDVRIGDCVTIGAGATVVNLKTIGDCATVGAGAVVVNDIPAGVVAKGVPAKYDEG